MASVSSSAMRYRRVESTRQVARQPLARHPVVRPSPITPSHVISDPPDHKLEYMTQLAVEATGSDIGGIGLVFQSQVWLPARSGIDDTLLPLSGSFCGAVVQDGADWFELADASLDARFASNPLISQSPHYHHYAAVPLRGDSAHLLGTLWVMSRQVRVLEQWQSTQMQQMARVMADLLELRYCDRVTGMFNRPVFVHHLSRLLAKEEGQALVVGIVDLVNFRQVNDLFRRAAGDRILRQTGKRLEQWGQGALLGHLGGDQFAFALRAPKHELVQRVQHLCSLIDQPYEIEPGTWHTLHARIGTRSIALPYQGEAVELLDTAEAAAAAVGQQHDRSVAHEYDDELIERTRLRYELFDTIRGGARFGQLEVYYQPQVDVVRGRLAGLEALVRWNHPQRGLLEPGTFVPHAEQAGRIFELDVYVLDRVCDDIQAWRAQGLEVAPVALNFSRASLMHSEIYERLAEALQRTGVPGELLEVEVTESLLSESRQMLHARVSALRALGVRVAVDDFGTGSSNLDALTAFPFDRLKADRQFVHGVSNDQRTAGVFAMIQGIAAVFDAELLCEGLEDEADLSWLEERGVHFIQGWYFSRAKSASAIAEVLLRFQREREVMLTVPQMRALLS